MSEILHIWFGDRYLNQAAGVDGRGYANFRDLADYYQFLDRAKKLRASIEKKFLYSDFFITNFFRIALQYPALFYFVKPQLRSSATAAWLTSIFGFSHGTAAYFSQGNIFVYGIITTAIQSLTLNYKSMPKIQAWEITKGAALPNILHLFTLNLALAASASFRANDNYPMTLLLAGVASSVLMFSNSRYAGSLKAVLPFLLVNALLPLKIEQFRTSEKLKHDYALLEKNYYGSNRESRFD